jgi:integrator complex subunit 9
LALAPYQPLAIRVAHCPIDWRLSFQELNSLLKEIHPKQIIIPNKYAPKENPSPRLNIMPIDGPTTSYQPFDILKITLQHRFDRAVISAQLAKQLNPTMRGDIGITDLSAVLSTFDYKYTLNQASMSDLNTLQLYRQRHLCGTPKANKLIETLRKVSRIS